MPETCRADAPHLDSVLEEGGEHLLVGFAEGGIAALVDEEDRRGQHQSLDGLAMPPDNLLLGRQHSWDVQNDTQLGVVLAQAPHLVPPLPPAALSPACAPTRAALCQPDHVRIASCEGQGCDVACTGAASQYGNSVLRGKGLVIK